jgi:glycosyltransferase involved in cell wall biosynthesis
MNPTSPLRILHLVHQYPPEHLGGTELYTQTVARALSERNHPSSVFTRRNGEGVGSEERSEYDVTVHLAWNGTLSPTRRFLNTFGNNDLELAFDRVLETFQPDLVHLQHLMGLPTSLLDQVRRRRIPFVVTLHDFWWICANAQLVTNYSGEICDGPSLWLNCARCLVARSQQKSLWTATPVLAMMLAHRGSTLNSLLSQAACMIAPSHFVKKWYVEHGIPAEQIRVLSHGIERPVHAPHARKEDAPRRFLYAGGLAWQKGVHVLLDAFSGVSGPCELWIAGDESFDPAYSARLHALAARKPDQRVRFLGKLSRQEVWQTLAQVDALVTPSLWYETFSLIIHEAFAAVVPVIASRLGALAEAVHPEVDGLLVEAGNVDAWRQTLQRLVDEPALVARLKEGIRPPMSLDDHLAQLLAIYREAIETRR